MTRRIERWDKDDWAQFRGYPFVAMDPGKDGFLLYFEAGAVRPKFGAPAFSPEPALRVMASNRICPLILEARFLHNLKHSSAVMELCFTAGIAVGMLSMWPGELVAADVLEVSPHTWQAAQIAREQRERGEGVAQALALEVAEAALSGTPEWKRAHKGLKTGIASAYGIAQWWQGVTA